MFGIRSSTSAYEIYSFATWEATERTSNTDEGKKENSQIGWVLHILSRLSQVERPHDDLMSLSTVRALVGPAQGRYSVLS